jgi:hypothetical protein
MGNHPNRSRDGSSSRNSTPGDVRDLRAKYGLTQTEAAERWLTTINAVNKWESSIGSDNHRRVHPLMWWAMQRILEGAEFSAKDKLL